MLNENLLYKAIGENIKALRIRHGMNQSQLADKLNLNRTSVTSIEIGKQRVTTFVLYKICEIFNITPLSLLPPIDSFIEHKIKTNSGISVIGAKTMRAINKYRNEINGEHND